MNTVFLLVLFALTAEQILTTGVAALSTVVLSLTGAIVIMWKIQQKQFQDCQRDHKECREHLSMVLDHIIAVDSHDEQLKRTNIRKLKKLRDTLNPKQ